MEFSRQYLTRLAQESNFIKDTLEKVLRLSEILKFLNSDMVFKDKLALKGGTAINLTAVELPRLSVDIDLDFTINVNKDELPEFKEKFKKRLTDYMLQERYSLADSRDHFALTSFLFNYTNSADNRDNIKVEINFLDRCHVLPLEKKQILTKGIMEDFEVLTLNTTELYASKINALLSRATPRDLYDVNAMIENNVINDTVLLRKCLIFYNAIGGDYDIQTLDYKNIERLDYRKYKTQLKPVISKDDKFDIEKAKEIVVAYVKDLLVLTDSEKEFLSKLQEKIYAPELLFSDEGIIINVKNHPAALWRVRENNN